MKSARLLRPIPCLIAAALMLAGGGHATPVLITPNSQDLIVGQRQSGAPLTNGYHTDPSQSIGAGVTGGAGSRYNRNAVIGFLLPTLNPGETIDTASFRITISNNNSAGGGKPVALYGLSTANPDNSGTMLFTTDMDPGTLANAGHALLNANFSSTGSSSGTPQTDVSDFIRSFYTGHVPHRAEVFFRICPTQDTWVTTNRLDFSKGSARLEVTTAPGTPVLHRRTGSDPTLQQLIDSGVVVPGVSVDPGPVPGSAIHINQAMLAQQTGSYGAIPSAIRIHTENNPSVLRSNFGNFTRWYQEVGNVQVMRLFQGDQNIRSGVGEDGSPGRIEAFFPMFTVSSGTWSVWEGTYTFIEPLGSTIFQLFHEGGQLWPFHLGVSSAGEVSFNRRNSIAGLPDRITIATNMKGRSIRFRIRANGLNYEIFKRIPGEDPDWVLVTTGSYTQAVDNRISFRWGMYVGSRAGQSVPRDGLMFVTGVTRTTSTAPGVAPPPPPPPVTYYWDGNGAAAGFGTASGVWGETTTGNATQGWSTDATGETLPEDVSTEVLDPVFFGTNTSGRGLGSGTITVSDTVVCADITFGSQSGNITLAGGEIYQGGNRTITAAGTGKTHTILSELSGFGTRTIGGGSTLQLYGLNSFVEPLTIGDNTNSNLRVRFNTITDVDGGPSSLGAPLTSGNGVIQIGSVSHTSTLEFTNASAAQSTNRRIRIGSNSNGSGGATILNNNSDPDHTLTFSNSSFNPAATGISTTNRTLTLGGSNTGDNTIHGAIIDNVGTSGGKVRVTKSGNGTWVLNGANTHSNGTTISGGLLRARITQTASALGTGTVSVGASATLILENQSTTNVANVPTIGNVFTGSGLLQLQFAAETTARNTYLPNVTGFGGTIQLANTGTTGDKWNASNIDTVAAAVVVDSGSSIFMSAGTNSFTGGITLNGAGNSEGRGAIRIGGASTVLNGEIRLASDATIGMENLAALITGDITSAAAGDQILTLGGTQGSQAGGTLSGNIGGGTGTLHLTVANGSYTLTGSNTYTGDTTVNQGTLALVGTSMASPISVASGARLGFTLGSPATTASSVDLTNGTVRITGAVDNATSYTLITAVGGITGAPSLDEPIPDYELRVRNGGTELVLAYLSGVSAFDLWSGGAAPDEDSNGDGVPNAIAWALGADSPLENARGLLPTLDHTGDPDYLLFAFNRSDAAEADPDTTIAVEFGTNLSAWTTAVHDGDNVIIEVTDGSPSDAVVVKLKRATLAPGGILFARLSVVIDTP